MPIDAPKPLWLTPERLATVRHLIAIGDPTARAIYRAAQRGLPDSPESLEKSDYGSEPLTSMAVLACLDENANLAHDAVRRWLKHADALKDRGELGRADVALCGACMLDATRHLLSKEDLADITFMLRTLSLEFRIPDVPHGDPHIVTNNHWGVAHAAAAIAGLAANDGSDEMADHIAWADGRTRAYIRLIGEHGLYHEGIGYHMYPAAYWLAWLMTSKPTPEELDFLSPGLRFIASSLYAVSRPNGTFGGILSWNDSDPTWTNSSTAILLVTLAPENQRGALRTLFDARNGIGGDAMFGPRHGGLFFTLAFYPFDTPAADPNPVLPRSVVDNRQGYVIFRNGYRDANDVLFGGYARCTHAGGHKQDDAGSIRFSAYGHDWIVGGGQNRGNAEWQSLVTADSGGRPRPTPCGALAWVEETPNGGIFGFDLRKTSGAYAERWAGIRFREDRTDLVLLDTIDDFTKRNWIWNLSIGPDLTIELHPDSQGFTLGAKDGTRLVSRFVGQLPDSLEIAKMPDTSRTYQGGAKILYPGAPFIRAHFRNRPHLAITWCAQVSPRAIDPLEINLEGFGLNVRFDDSLWTRPLGHGIAPTYNPFLGGTPSRFPDGAEP